MDEILRVIQFLIVISHAISTVYFTYNAFDPQRNRLLYSALATNFGFWVIWSGADAIIPAIRSTVEPWQAIPALFMVVVVIRSISMSQNRRERNLRALEQRLSLEVRNGHAETGA